jgi:hypothetical protein
LRSASVETILDIAAIGIVADEVLPCGGRAMTKVCLSCREPHVRPLLDFGPVPLTNHFRSAAEADAPAEAFRLKLGQCGRCGLVQLIDPPPPATVRAKVPWIAYQEPEGHLDDLAERLLKLQGVGKRSVAVGLRSSKRRGRPTLWSRGICWSMSPSCRGSSRR